MFYVYVLQDLDEPRRFYLGYTADLRKRVVNHNVGISRYTRKRRWRLVYYEAYISSKAARRRELRLKRNSRMKGFLMDRIKDSLQEAI